MRKKKVFWKTSGAKFNVPPSTAEREMEKIRTEYGSLKPEYVIAEASKARHPLHASFNWDNTDAAHKYRLLQAGDMIRCLAVIITDGKTEHETRAYLNVKIETMEKGYHPTRVVMSDAEGREYVVRKALKRFQALRTEYNHLKELAGVFRALDKVKV